MMVDKSFICCSSDMLAGQSPSGKSESLLPKQPSSPLRQSSGVKESGLANSNKTSQLTNQEYASDHKKSKKKKSETQFTSILKFFNIIIGIMVISFSVYCYIGVSTESSSPGGMPDLVKLILPGYIAFSGLIILAIEVHIGFFVRNMRFLYNYFGRGVFNIYVGIMPMTLLRGKDSSGQEQDILFQIMIYVVVSMMVLIGVLYILAKVLCCAQESDKKKKRRRRREESSSDEDSD